MGKASQLPFLAKSLRQEIDSSESDSTIIESHPLLAPSLHPCKIAKASAIATPLAFIQYLQAARKRPSSFLATTPVKPIPSLATQLTSTLILIAPGIGGDHWTTSSSLLGQGKDLTLGAGIYYLKAKTEREIAAKTLLGLRIRLFNRKSHLDFQIC
ncbi:hypothetical protein ACFX11_012223 [Malus domestica]